MNSTLGSVVSLAMFLPFAPVKHKLEIYLHRCRNLKETAGQCAFQANKTGDIDLLEDDDEAVGDRIMEVIVSFLLTSLFWHKWIALIWFFYKIPYDCK